MSDDEFDGRGFKGEDEDDDFDDECDDVDVIDDELNEEEKQEHGDGTGGIRRGLRKVPDEQRITSRFMTKYERARILGSRAL